MKNFHEILQIQNDNHKKQIFSSKFSIVFEVVKFRLNDYKIFINNYDMIMSMIVIFLHCKMFFH